MLRVWIVKANIFIFLSTMFLLIIVLLYLATLCSGTQSIMADRDTRRSDGTDKRKGVR